MKVLILGGFLGSGKTTLLLQLARYLVDSSGSGSAYKVVTWRISSMDVPAVLWRQGSGWNRVSVRWWMYPDGNGF